MADWRALIVEDEDDSAEVVTRILDFHRKTYSVANTAEEALKFLESEIPDVFIVDLALPEMDGWEFLQATRESPDTAGVPAVAITAYHSSNVAQEAIQAGFEAYFPKPIDTTAFVRELERILNGDS